MRAKLVLLSLAIVIVVSFGFTVLHLTLSQRWVDEDLRERAITFAREIAATIGDRRELENSGLLQSQIRSDPGPATERAPAGHPGLPARWHGGRRHQPSGEPAALPSRRGRARRPRGRPSPASCCATASAPGK